MWSVYPARALLCLHQLEPEQVQSLGLLADQAQSNWGTGTFEDLPE